MRDAPADRGKFGRNREPQCWWQVFTSERKEVRVGIGRTERALTPTVFKWADFVCAAPHITGNTGRGPGILGTREGETSW